MSPTLRFSCWAYEKLLFLYPDDLRGEFASEMLLVFAEDLNEATHDRGVLGAIRAWWCALGALRQIALPGQRTNPEICVPLVALMFSVITMSAELMFALRHGTGAMDGSLSYQPAF